MLNMRKYLMISAADVMGIFGILLMIRALRRGHCTGVSKKSGKGIDERLSESKAALDKATAHVKNVLDRIINPKP